MDTKTVKTDAPHRFVHLHLHSEYSLLDGGNRLDRLISHVKASGMDAVAVTDHGNMYGAVEFYTKATAAGIKPILGIEAYIAPGDRTDKTPTGIADGGFHLVLLAENETGWRNLLKLSSDSFLKGFYYKPRMDKSTLARWSDGLIAINGHLGSSIAFHLLRHVQTGKDAHYDEAVREARWHAETFGTNERGEPCFFVELQQHDVREQQMINPVLVKLARELDLPLVGDNDAHFLRRDDWDHHDTLCCISMQKLKEEENRLKYSRDLYVKSPREMADAFRELPEAVENTLRIAERCNVSLDFNENHAPVVRVVHPGIPPGYDPRRDGSDTTEWFKAYCRGFALQPFDVEQDRGIDPETLKQDCDRALRDLCEAGLIWRYGTAGVTEEIRVRLERELQVLADKLISAYFLIVWDFVDWARQRGIPANARGSGVGTMVGYVLGLSNACPVEYGLLFERFTDPDRSEYPDIDIDICQNGRADVLNYVREKYGHVAQIITFGRLKAKQAVKDVARVMGFPPTEGQRLANLVPAELNITIDDALGRAPDLKKLYDADPKVRAVFDSARALENHARHVGVHAAGVVVATQPLDNIVPLCRATGSEDAVTQWDGPTCEKVGLLKMDFLGLRTLSTIERARELIRTTLDEYAIWKAVGRAREAGGPHPLDLDRLEYTDQKVFDLFRRGDVPGIFQFESGGMRRLLIDMQPDRLEDLIAANALYRPGPMDLIPNYNNRKHGKEAVPSVHEIVDRFTAETYGIMVYQEQVMQIVHGLGGIPLRAAYSLIKAISKKKESVINAERPKFIAGAKDKGLSERQANELFDLILKFAGYGFNKSHSTGYAIIAYQTAYLKTYFPNQYMAAVLTFESQARKVEDWVPYLDDCRRTSFPDDTPEKPHRGVLVLPPDINRSHADFSVVFDPDEPRDALHGHIRFGLSAIKGAGQGAIRSIISERDANGPYESLFDFCERVDLRSVNKATIESLVKCGAFDSIHSIEQRASLAASIEDACRAGQAAAEDKRAGQMNFFDSFSTSTEETALPSVPLANVEPWDTLETLRLEKEVMGFHISGHPLDTHAAALSGFCTHTIGQLADSSIVGDVIIGGLITNVRTILLKRGQNAGQTMAILTIEDKTGTVEAAVFSDAFSRYQNLVEVDRIVLLIGTLDHERGEPNVKIQRIVAADDAPRQMATCIEVNLGRGNSPATDAALTELHQVLSGSAIGGQDSPDGRAADIVLHLYADATRYTIKPQMLRVVAEPALIHQLGQIVGPEQIRMRGGPPHLYMSAQSSRNGRPGRWKRSAG